MDQVTTQRTWRLLQAFILWHRESQVIFYRISYLLIASLEYRTSTLFYSILWMGFTMYALLWFLGECVTAEFFYYFFVVKKCEPNYALLLLLTYLDKSCTMIYFSQNEFQIDLTCYIQLKSSMCVIYSCHGWYPVNCLTQTIGLA